jgi:uncharacterized membrane protein
VALVNPAGDPRGGKGPNEPPRPGLQPTSVATLIITGVIAGVLGFLFIRTYYGSVPDLNWLPGLTLAGLAIVEFVSARNTRARIERRPGYGRINPFVAARYAVLAKASSLLGAIFAGVYGGVAVWALLDRDFLAVAARNLGPAVAGLVGALALAAAALLLERACRVPPPPEDEDEKGSGRSSTHR